MVKLICIVTLFVCLSACENAGSEPSPMLDDAGSRLARDSAVRLDGARVDAATEGTNASTSYVCTLTIGFSQVGQPDGGWFTTGGVFESVVDDHRWQLLWNGGGGVDLWQDPDYVGWERELVSPCATNSDSPDRVLLVVSGPYGNSVESWTTAIEASVREIRSRYHGLREIVLQPVVGGPDHRDCYDSSGALIRASWQHAHIDEAIARVASGDVVVGFSPEVGACEDYRDPVGHLHGPAAEAIARTIGEHYLR